MKASELRCGNWVCIHSIELQMCIDDFNFREDFFIPIPLTDEWLLKFGFKYVESYDNYKVKAGDYWNSVKFYEGEWCYNNDDSDSGCYFLTTIKYVHQLQNLYFALTGEELTTHNE